MDDTGEVWMFRRCSRCKQTKLLDEFYVSSKGKIYCVCKQCESERHKLARRLRPYTREELDARCSITKTRQARIRLEALAHYSGGRPQCRCCGEYRVEFLSIDHIAGGGNRHRKEYRYSHLPIWLRKHGYPDGYQVLCFNCNMAKRNNATCPHHKWPDVTIHKFSDVAGDALIGAGTIIWNAAVVGMRTSIGMRCVIGSHTYVGSDVVIGNETRIQSQVFIPNKMQIGERVFIGPHVVFTDDKHPVVNNPDYKADPPILEDNCSIGAGATVLPGVRVGRFAMVGAGAVVTHDVEPHVVVVGCPATPLSMYVSPSDQELVRRWYRSVTIRRPDGDRDSTHT